MHNGLDLLPKRCFRASRDQRSCVCKFVSEQVESVYGDCCYSGNLYEKSQFTVTTDQRKDSCARTSSVIMCWQSGARENQNYARHARDCKAKKACPMCKNVSQSLMGDCRRREQYCPSIAALRIPVSTLIMGILSVRNPRKLSTVSPTLS